MEYESRKMFFTNVHPIRGSRATQVRGLEKEVVVCAIRVRAKKIRL